MYKSIILALLATAFAIPNEINLENADTNTIAAVDNAESLDASQSKLEFTKNFFFGRGRKSESSKPCFCPLGGCGGHKKEPSCEPYHEPFHPAPEPFHHEPCQPFQPTHQPFHPAPQPFHPAPQPFQPAPQPFQPAPQPPREEKQCFDIPPPKPSTVTETQVKTHTRTSTRTELSVATSLETLVTTVTSTHLSTHTQLFYPETTQTLTRTEAYVVFPGYTVTAGRPGYTESLGVSGNCAPTPAHEKSSHGFGCLCNKC